MTRWTVKPCVLLLVGALVTLVFPGAGSAATSPSRPLVGTFEIEGGSCAGGTASGSYIRMVLPGGSLTGPYMSNSDSTCSDQSYTLMAPGSDGGLKSGSYQPNPSPAFNSAGDALAHGITSPSNYYGENFAPSTNPTDPQTGLKVPAPSITLTGDSLSGQMTALSVAWNGQYFNQGSPKPDGTRPGLTEGPTGTYDPSTGSFTLQWASEVVGGPFNSFTGFWHLVGHFVPAATATTPTTAPAATPAAAGSTATTAPPGAAVSPNQSSSAANSNSNGAATSPPASAASSGSASVAGGTPAVSLRPATGGGKSGTG